MTSLLLLLLLLLLLQCYCLPSTALHATAFPPCYSLPSMLQPSCYHLSATAPSYNHQLLLLKLSSLNPDSGFRFQAWESESRHWLLLLVPCSDGHTAPPKEHPCSSSAVHSVSSASRPGRRVPPSPLRPASCSVDTCGYPPAFLPPFFHSLPYPSLTSILCIMPAVLFMPYNNIAIFLA